MDGSVDMHVTLHCMATMSIFESFKWNKINTNSKAVFPLKLGNRGKYRV